MLLVDRGYRFIERSTGFREHWKGREVVPAGGPAALIMELCH